MFESDDFLSTEDKQFTFQSFRNENSEGSGEHEFYGNLSLFINV